MSKKTMNAEAMNATANEEAIAMMMETANYLQDLFNTYENLSLRKVAESLELSYPMILKASKKPIVGVAYDPDAKNFAEVARYINNKNVYPEDLEGYDWEQISAKSVGAGSTLSKNFDDFGVGAKVYLRSNNDTPYTIVYKTATHVVLLLDGTEEPRCLSASTFFFQGPSFTQRTKTTTEEADA